MSTVRIFFLSVCSSVFFVSLACQVCPSHCIHNCALQAYTGSAAFLYFSQVVTSYTIWLYHVHLSDIRHYSPTDPQLPLSALGSSVHQYHFLKWPTPNITKKKWAHVSVEYGRCVHVSPYRRCCYLYIEILEPLCQHDSYLAAHQRVYIWGGYSLSSSSQCCCCTCFHVIHVDLHSLHTTCANHCALCVHTANLPTEPGEYVVLLADRKLLELPLESLSILRQEGLSSVSRDFSVQLLHSRLNQLQPEKGTKDTYTNSFLKKMFVMIT